MSWFMVYMTMRITTVSGWHVSSVCCIVSVCVYTVASQRSLVNDQ